MPHPPSITDLRAAFLASHPGYMFMEMCGVSYVEDTEWAAAQKDLNGRPVRNPDPFKSTRHKEWLAYISDVPTSIIAAARASRGHLGDLHERIATSWSLCWSTAQMSADPGRYTYCTEAAYMAFRRLHPTLSVESIRMEAEARAAAAAAEAERRAAAAAAAAREVAAAAARSWASHQESERAATLARAAEAAATSAAERQQYAADSALILAHEKHIARTAKVSALATRQRLTQQEAEAVLAHLDTSTGYQKDTLLALQVINRFAAANGIRPEDAMVVLRE
jgi:hypothetical protein